MSYDITDCCCNREYIIRRVLSENKFQNTINKKLNQLILSINQNQNNSNNNIIKGFIQITEIETNKPYLIKTDSIINVSNNVLTINPIENKIHKIFCKESFNEIVQKIKEATT